MMDKKAVEIRFMILLVLGIIVFLVLIILVPRLLGEGAGETGGLLDQTKDTDTDQIADFFDKCPCTPGIDDNDGCKTGVTKDPTGCNPPECEGCSVI